jgi:energy-converting hydrogenase Eha subunit A
MVMALANSAVKTQETYSEMPRPKPKYVQIALASIWLSNAILMLEAFVPFFFFKSDKEFQVGMLVLIASVVSFSVSAFLALKIASGRNWARWTLSVIYVFAVLSLCSIAFFSEIDSFGWSAIDFASAAVQYGLVGAAVMLLFSSESKVWFEKNAPEGEP